MDLRVRIWWILVLGEDSRKGEQRNDFNLGRETNNYKTSTNHLFLSCSSSLAETRRIQLRPLVRPSVLPWPYMQKLSCFLSHLSNLFFRLAHLALSVSRSAHSKMAAYSFEDLDEQSEHEPDPDNDLEIELHNEPADLEAILPIKKKQNWPPLPENCSQQQKVRFFQQSPPIHSSIQKI